MRLADHSSRIVAGCAIAIAHVAAIYGLLTARPHLRTNFESPPVAIRFITQFEARPRWRPREVTAAPPEVVAHLPQLPVIELKGNAASDRAISAPQRIAPAAQAAKERSIPKLVSAVEYLREPAPRYPPQSRRLREEGVVVLRVVIDEKGRACNIDIESSSGYARLDRAAREAVASAAFRPYVEDGAPRRAQVLIPIEFFLNRSSA